MVNARQAKIITDMIGALQLPINVGDLLIHSLLTGKTYRVTNEDELLKALDVSEPFDTIILEDGTYNTSIKVDKSLNIIGPPKAELVSDTMVIDVTYGNRVNLVGFTAQRTNNQGSVISFWSTGSILGMTIKGGQWALSLSGSNVRVMYNNISDFLDYAITTQQAGHFIAFNVITADGTQYKDGILANPGVIPQGVPPTLTIYGNTLVNIYRGVIVQGTFGVLIQGNLIYATEAGVVMGSAIGINPIPSVGTKVIYNTIMPYGTTLNRGVAEIRGGTKSNYIAGNVISATNPIVVYASDTVRVGNVII